MYKKLLIATVLFVVLIFSFSVCFAANGLENLANDVRNVVGGAENVVEDGARDISNKSKEATGSMENGANDAGNAIGSTFTDDRDDEVTDTRYTATRTATDNTFMGMNATAWTWLIIGIVAIAIVALVWYYSLQFSHHNHHND